MHRRYQGIENGWESKTEEFTKMPTVVKSVNPANTQICNGLASLVAKYRKAQSQLSSAERLTFVWTFRSKDSRES